MRVVYLIDIALSVLNLSCIERSPLEAVRFDRLCVEGFFSLQSRLDLVHVPRGEYVKELV